MRFSLSVPVALLGLSSLVAASSVIDLDTDNFEEVCPLILRFSAIPGSVLKNWTDRWREQTCFGRIVRLIHDRQRSDELRSSFLSALHRKLTSQDVAQEKLNKPRWCGHCKNRMFSASVIRHMLTKLAVAPVWEQLADSFPSVRPRDHWCAVLSKSDCRIKSSSPRPMRTVLGASSVHGLV